MKRFVAILMAAAMLLTVLAGCSGSTEKVYKCYRSTKICVVIKNIIIII